MAPASVVRQQASVWRQPSELYYQIAPQIVAAIPWNHGEWKRIGDDIDRSLAAILADRPEAAARIYVLMMRRLIDRWAPDRISECPSPSPVDDFAGRHDAATDAKE